MSAKIETLVICDGPGCGEVFADGDQRHKTASQQRQSYRDEGWRFVGGKDLCPTCWAARTRGPHPIVKYFGDPRW